jgi:hypothetical protein
VQKVLDVIMRKSRPTPEIPVCPDHKLEMRLRGKLGRPARFADQTGEEYTLIYFCPAEACNQTATREWSKSQIPVAGESPNRPAFSRRG